MQRVVGHVGYPMTSSLDGDVMEMSAGDIEFKLPRGVGTQLAIADQNGRGGVVICFDGEQQGLLAFIGGQNMSGSTEHRLHDTRRGGRFSSSILFKGCGRSTTCVACFLGGVGF